MKSVFGFRVRLGNPDLDFENVNRDFPIERTLGVLPKFHSKAFLKIHEYPSADDFEGKKRLHGV